MELIDILRPINLTTSVAGLIVTIYMLRKGFELRAVTHSRKDQYVVNILITLGFIFFLRSFSLTIAYINIFTIDNRPALNLMSNMSTLFTNNLTLWAGYIYYRIFNE